MKLWYVKTNPSDYEDKYEGICNFQVVKKDNYQVGDLINFVIADFIETTLAQRYGKEVLDTIDTYKQRGYETNFKEIGQTTKITAYKENATKDVYKIIHKQELPDSNYMIIGFVRLEMAHRQ